MISQNWKQIPTTYILTNISVCKGNENENERF